MDLSQVLNLRAEHLDLGITLQGPGSTLTRSAISTTTWKLQSAEINLEHKGPEPASQWMCVQDLIGGLLGVVPFSRVHVQGQNLLELAG